MRYCNENTWLTDRINGTDRFLYWVGHSVSRFYSRGFLCNYQLLHFVLFITLPDNKPKFSILMLAFMVWAINDSVFPYFLKRIVNTVQAYHGLPAGIYAAVGGSLFIGSTILGNSGIFYAFARDFTNLYLSDNFAPIFARPYLIM